MEISSLAVTSGNAARPATRSLATVWIAIFAVAIALLYLGTIGNLPLLGKDEPRYVEVAREMWSRGDWVTPTLNQSTWFEKPALLYWLLMASFSAFGVSEWTARLGPALCGLATIALIFWAARAVERRDPNAKNLAAWSALAMASCIGLIAFAHGATFDIVLTATITLALVCFFLSELETVPRQRNWLLAGLWSGVGLSLLAKGLVGIILPCGVIGLYLLLRRDWRGVKRLQVFWGVPLALAVAAVWYGPVIARHGMVFINEFFIQHHFARFFSNKFQHAQPAYYYLPVLALFALPWTAFLLTTLWESAPAKWRDDDAPGKLRALALSWLAVPVIFFSLSDSKLPGYILPALPGAMLLVGIGVADYVRGQSGAGRARISGALLLILGIGAAIYAHRSHTMSTLGIGAVALPLIGAGVLALTMAHRRALCAGALGGAVVLASGILAGGAGVPLGESRSVRELLDSAAASDYQKEAVWQLNTTQRTAEFYAAGRLKYDVQGEPHEYQNVADIARDLPPNGAILLLVPLVQTPALLQSPLLRTQALDEDGRIALVRVRALTKP